MLVPLCVMSQCVYLCVYTGVCVTLGPYHTCGGQRATFGNWLSPSTVCVQGIKFRSSGFAAIAFTQWSILLPLTLIIINRIIWQLCFK